jgi:hypothetical protein
VLVVPLQREPRFDGGQIVLKARREAGQLCDTAVHRLGHPRPHVLPSALPDHGQKGLAQRIPLRHVRFHLAQLIQIRLRVARPLGGRTDHGE